MQRVPKRKCHMQKFKIVLLVMLVLLVLTPVSAINVSFADPDATTHRDVYVYGSDGALDGVYNTTSAGIEITGDSMFVIKPQYSSPLDDPGAFLTAFIGWIETNALVLLLMSMVGALLFKRF